MIASSASGTAGLSPRTGAGMSSARLVRIAMGLGPLPGRQPVQQHPQAEQVAAVVDLAPPRLLRRHVRRGADHRPGVGQLGLGVDRPGGPEVEHLDRPVRGLQPQVRRFDVAVDETELVRGGQPGRGLGGNPHDLGDRR